MWERERERERERNSLTFVQDFELCTPTLVGKLSQTSIDLEEMVHCSPHRIPGAQLLGKSIHAFLFFFRISSKHAIPDNQKAPKIAINVHGIDSVMDAMMAWGDKNVFKPPRSFCDVSVVNPKLPMFEQANRENMKIEGKIRGSYCQEIEIRATYQSKFREKK